MNTGNIELSMVFKVADWEPVQREISKLTGVSMLAVDYKGAPITPISGCSAFCAAIRKKAEMDGRCSKCFSLGGMEAIRQRKPYHIFLCHFGMACVSIPIVVRDKYLGGIMLEQILLPENEKAALGSSDRLIAEVSRFDEVEGETKLNLSKMYSALPQKKLDEVVEIAEMVSALVHYTLEMAMQVINTKRTYEWMLQGAIPYIFDDPSKNAYEIQERDKVDMFMTTSMRYANKEIVKKDSPVFLAISYIHEHTNEMVNLKDMAALCHLSPSYFSKAFYKEVGEHFRNYQLKYKLDMAKEKLINTNMNVDQIALTLGFQDASYFIKIFKKFEDITPNVYRNKKKLIT